MAQPRRPNRPRDGRLELMLSPPVRAVCTGLNLLPLPGVGGIIAGWRNPHTGLRRNGALQLVLVVLGSWPLVVPGVLGACWAIWDTIRIANARLLPPPPAGGRDPDATPQKG